MLAREAKARQTRVLVGARNSSHATAQEHCIADKPALTTAFSRPVENNRDLLTAGRPRPRHWHKVHPDFGAAVAKGIGLGSRKISAE